MQYDKAIKIIRSIYGLSQKELAQKTGLSQSVISRVESRERIPTDQFVDRLLESLDIPRELFDFLVNKNESKISPDERLILAKNLLRLISTKYE